jgi:Kef-type K+ transport system membrane component KefB/nucleotide-binding universal stress UspA family protein
MILPAVLLLLSAGTALAAEAGGGASEALFIVQLIALLLVGRLLGEAMLRAGQPAVMGQLIAGLILGPSVLGALWPDLQHSLFPASKEQRAMLGAVSEFGVLLLLLLTGMETDLKLVRQTGRAALSASVAGIAVPFLCGFALGEFLPDSMLPDPDKRLITSLFLGTALSIASVKIVATVIREMNFMRRTVGQVILGAAIVDDTVGWIIIAIIFGLALEGHVDPWSVAKSVLGTLAFMAVSLTVGRRVVSLVIRWVNDNSISEFAVITAILLIMGLMALTTHLIGVHAILGAFVAGILVGESPILTRHIDEQLRGLIVAFFMPVFFGIAGLSADLTILKEPRLALLTLALIAIASLGKFGGAFIGGKLGGLTPRESLALATGMNARGSTEVIVATIGLSMGALSQDLFTMIVAMAVLTTLAMPPTLRWSLARLPIRKDEKQRLEREEIEAKGFVPNLERLLLAVDGSANGQFASRLTGLIAGMQSMPTTVMHIADARKLPAKAEGDRPEPPDDEARKAAELAGQLVKDVARQITRGKSEEKPSPGKLDITTVAKATAQPDAIAKEARKGYDMLVIGLEKTVVRGGGFHAGVRQLASGFEGPLAVVEARGDLLEEPLQSKLSILVPVNGTNTSRRAAEVAITLARTTRAPVTVLYVAPRTTSEGRRRARRNADAILKDIVALGEGYDIDVRTAVQADIAPEDAVVKETARRQNNLVLMGVERRPGEKLFFGETAAAIMEKSACSLVFVAT